MELCLSRGYKVRGVRRVATRAGRGGYSKMLKIGAASFMDDPLVQIKSDETAQLLYKPYVNEVYLRGQNLT